MRVIQLDDGSARRRFIIDAPEIALSEVGDGKRSWVTLTREGEFSDPRYGRFKITGEMLANMVKNFRANVYGQKIFIDIAHRPQDGAAGEVLDLKHERGRLRALVAWTPLGVDAINNKGYTYLSIEYADDFQDNESLRFHGATMLGAGLVVRPAIKHLDPVEKIIELAEVEGADGAVPTFLHPELASRLIKEFQELTMNKEQLIRELTDKLKSKGLAEAVINMLIAQYKKQLEAVTDAAVAKQLAENFEALGDEVKKQLAANPGATITLNAPSADDAAKAAAAAAAAASAAKTLTADDVTRLLAEHDAKKAEEAKKLAEGIAGKKKILADALNAAKSLTEEQRTNALKELGELVTVGMTDDQVKSLAAFTITQLANASVAAQLAARGYEVNGTVILAANDQGVKKLQSLMHEKLKLTASATSGALKLREKVAPFVEKVLACFDVIHGQRLNDELKLLSGGQVGIADTNLPLGVQREVIREALSDLRILDLIAVDVDANAQATTQVPYETRDVAAVYNNGVVFEGNAIHKAGISQAMDTAYIQPMKLAMLLSNEVIHFTRTSAINWDAWARNIDSNSRLMRELIARRIMNELIRTADAFGAVAVSAEAFDSQLTGSNSIIKTAQFPLVRPFQQKDLKGSNIGSVENPIVLTLNGTALSEYDGTGTQPNGTYYRITNANLGYIQLVNQAGVAQTPTDSGTNTISYHYATNVTKVDLDLGSLTMGVARNKILQGIGTRKAILADQRFVKPDYLLLSETLHNECTNADQFTFSYSKDGTSLTQMGDLADVKGTAAYGTNQPSTDLGTERILIAPRGHLAYTIAKPFTMGEPFEAVNSAGVPIGKKQAYGEEYSAIHVPAPIRNRVTSVLAYSFTGR